MSPLPKESAVYCDACGAANRPQARFCIACGQAMPVLSSFSPIAYMGTTPSSPTEPLSPHTLLKGRYRILGSLGRGGMGTVYKAEDTGLGNRLVAVKVMSQSGLSPHEVAEAAEGFKREAHLLAGLRHRHLPGIHDHFGEGGRWYLVMDFIEGESLETYLAKGGRLPVEEVLEMGIQLSTVLGYLHTHQPPIIFRDLKPSNVMRTSEGDLCLIDFGIARHFKPGQAKDTVAYGSAGYAAPEQYGKAQTTPQSDIYSLGAMLHHLLSGNDPSANIPTPFDFPPLHFSGQLAGLEALTMQMVEKVSSKRPASIAEVRQQLQWLKTQATGSQSALIYASSAALPPAQPVSVSSPPGTLLSTYKGHSSLIHVVAWSPDGRRIASGSKDKTVQVWDAATGKTLLTYRGHSSNVLAVAWSPDGRRIASGSKDKTVQVWDAATGKTLLTYRGHSSWVYTVAWSRDGKRIASGARDMTVQVWDAATGKTLLTYRDQHDVQSVAWSPDGGRIASASVDKTVQVWDAATGKTLLTYRGRSLFVLAVAWSPDGRRIASGMHDAPVQVWDAATGETLFSYWDHSSIVFAVAWSPDGRRIASGSRDKTVQVWDAATGKTLLTYRGHSSWVAWVRAVAWSPDGRRIASGSDDKTVQVWQAV